MPTIFNKYQEEYGGHNNSERRRSYSDVPDGLRGIQVGFGRYCDLPFIADILDKDFTENVIYEKLLTDKLPVNLGYVYENLVAQMLVASGNRLCPVEVKSSGYKTHASLDAFCLKYSSRIKDRYLIYTKDLAQGEETLYVPAYMTPLL